MLYNWSVASHRMLSRLLTAPVSWPASARQETQNTAWSISWLVNDLAHWSRRAVIRWMQIEINKHWDLEFKFQQQINHVFSLTNKYHRIRSNSQRLICHFAQIKIIEKKKNHSKPPPGVLKVIKSQFNQQSVKSLFPSTDAFGEKIILMLLFATQSESEMFMLYFEFPPPDYPTCLNNYVAKISVGHASRISPNVFRWMLVTW